MRNYLLLLAAILCLAAPQAWAAKDSVQPKAAKEAMPAKLSEKDIKEIERIEKYLNELKSVSAGFIQVSDSSEVRHGSIAIKRPGKMRVVYDLPNKDFIVADGSMVHIWDAEMEQQTNFPVNSGIAEFILRDPIKLSGDVTITKFLRFPAKMELSLVSTKDPSDGELTLIFEDIPLQLRQWRVVDAQGRMTGVSLENAREGVTFPSNTFDFVPPTLGKAPRSVK